ncbi:structural maintenance of chromosomes flexible hinge domain-containing protein GMI1-like isoform X1 [Tripterygium wilfordii]|uniref:structural maintenance of chromosomes flexible hinge domain-containing protein GMI1-like isoform X1 n=1 Tax=Tripterygium wilfordii TaxID=458696 RepID=UPI0018F836E4|nr:structural maintenance of chromosomes flexible hinge domain-containing protein GMI1-like isoform X1 [Tripterygium wilfordii]
MHLGRRARVSSKTKDSKKVFTLYLEREALLNNRSYELTWRTDGGIRIAKQDEIGKSPHGSFTKVDIVELKMKVLDMFKLQCKLKDIYFPYIQCDEVSNTGKTSRPIEFQVNGVDLAEIEGGEVAITNLHSCNGPEFIFQLHLSFTQENGASLEANARLRCVYFPIVEGKENIERILEKLEAEGSGTTERCESFSRVSIRRLGRLLLDARWASLPFMECRQKKGDRAQLLKRCCSRVKCFIETDAGFNPTPSKTDLAHHNPFTITLKNFGSKSLEKQKDVTLKIYRGGKMVTPSNLEREYQDWILQMHECYDQEIDSGEDQPVLVIGPANKKSFGISSDVVRVHRILKRKGIFWKHGQKIKVLKGACAGFHRNNFYAILEYFLIEGFQGEAGGEGRVICRQMGIPDEEGCILDVNNENASLDIRRSLSLPISVIDSGKCVVIDAVEWNTQLEKEHLKSPSTIELLCAHRCRVLKVNGEALPVDLEVPAGQDPPREIVAVVRPASYVVSKSDVLKGLDQKYIVKSNLEMIMEVKFRGEGEGEDREDVGHIYLVRVKPLCRNGIDGFYIFPLRNKLPKLFQQAGLYVFSFSIDGSSCQNFVKTVLVKASSKVGGWKLLSEEHSLEYSVSLGSYIPPLSISCYDTYGNRMPFTSVPKLMVKLDTNEGVLVNVNKMKAALSSDKLVLEVKELLIETNELDKIRPSYRATLVISPQDELVSVCIPCEVAPGFLQRVIAQASTPGNCLVPGFLFKKFILEMFDAYGNHVREGFKVELNANGFQFKDCLGLKRKVDNKGCIDLSGILELTTGYGKIASISVLFKEEVIFEQEFQTEKRELRIASEMPEFCIAGSQLDNIIFEIVNSEGHVDKTIHDDERLGHFHTLKIKSDSFNAEDSLRYTFKHGRCTVPSIFLPKNEGSFCLVAAHPRHQELQLSVKIPILRGPKVEYENSKSPVSEAKSLAIQDSLDHAGNLTPSIVRTPKGFDDIYRYGLQIADCEKELSNLNNQRAELDQIISFFRGDLEYMVTSPAMEPYLVTSPANQSAKEDMIRQIESRCHSAAAVVCSLSRESSVLDPQHHFMGDMVGLVALLGTVSSDKISRVLAEYLGEYQMLAVVCKTYESADALEKYRQNGEVDCKLALHGKAASLGKTIDGRFLVICLEDIRPYTGDLQKLDLQRRLVLPNPMLPDGNIPCGFIGYAVNMVDLNVPHLWTMTSAGHGLRETLFYHLFGELQVYETREHMKEARACIEHGAVSLDGGILREKGFLSLGYGNPGICFPVVATGNEEHCLPESVVNMMNQMEEKRQELRETIKSISIKTRQYDKVMKKFKKRYRKQTELFDRLQSYQSNMENRLEAASTQYSGFSPHF